MGSRDRLLLLGAALLSASILPGPADATSGAPPLSRIGTAGAVSGTVFAEAPEQAIGRVINSGKPLFLNDHVTTDAHGRLQVLLLDETVFTLGPSSDLVLDEFVYDPKRPAEGKVAARIVNGSFRFVTGAVARAKPSNMKVRLPVGSIGIRGTIVAGRVESGRSTVVLLGPGANNNAGEREGRIVVEASGRSVEISRPGFGTVIEGQAPPTPPAPVPPSQIRALNAALDAKAPKAEDDLRDAPKADSPGQSDSPGKPDIPGQTNPPGQSGAPGNPSAAHEASASPSSDGGSGLGVLSFGAGSTALHDSGQDAASARIPAGLAAHNTTLTHGFTGTSERASKEIEKNKGRKEDELESSHERASNGNAGSGNTGDDNPGNGGGAGNGGGNGNGNGQGAASVTVADMRQILSAFSPASSPVGMELRDSTSRWERLRSIPEGKASYKTEGLAYACSGGPACGSGATGRWSYQVDIDFSARTVGGGGSGIVVDGPIGASTQILSQSFGALTGDAALTLRAPVGLSDGRFDGTSLTFQDRGGIPAKAVTVDLRVVDGLGGAGTGTGTAVRP
ncbi:MAG: FecR domain-containing protein [Elusimicrobia bacterium]|nr:FecR domain-containing protein [Elusimicrobiota bacterium]